MKKKIKKIACTIFSIFLSCFMIFANCFSSIPVFAEGNTNSDSEEYNVSFFPEGFEETVDELNKEYQNSTKRKTKAKRSVTRSGNVSVTHLETMNVAMPWGGSILNGIWTLSNGHHAFCSEGLNASPHPGDAAPPQIKDNANLRKGLYYGYGGPADQLTGTYGRNVAIILTNELVSNANCGTCVSKAAVGGYHWNNGVSAIYNNIMALPDPIQYGYVAYSLDIPGQEANWQGVIANKQDLVYGDYSVGSVKVQKKSANTATTNGNASYSLQGAEFGVYSNAECTNSVGTLTTDASGNSGTLSLNAGTYYVKETKAPAGFTLDQTVHTVTVSAGQTATVTVSDIPQSEQPEEILNKVDKESGTSTPQGDATLTGAEFTIKYYDGQYTADPATQGARPKRTWTLRTDEEGTVSLDDAHKVSGDDFYLSSGGIPVLPVGTITIQETKAPTGYLLDNTVHVRQIKTKDQGLSEDINNYVAVTAQDQVMKSKIQVTKKDVESGKVVKKSGFVFEVYFHDGTLVDTITTNEQGIATSKNLPYGKYYVKEKSATKGYLVDTNQRHDINITADGQVYKTDFTDQRVKGKATISKVDSLTGNRTEQNEAVLDGAVYGLYAAKDILDPADDSVIYKADTLITQVTINDDPVTVDELYLGDYYWKEITAPKGYKIDKEKHTFSLNYKNDKTPIISNNTVVEEDVITGQFRISKTIADGSSTQIAEPEVGGQFIVVAKKYVEQYGDILTAYEHRAEFLSSEYDTLTTNEEGEAITKDLAYGDYVIKQTKAPEEIWVLKETFEFSVTQEDQAIRKYAINNIPAKYYVRIVKQDADTGENVSLSATSFKIKDLETNEYITQKLGNITYDVFTTTSSREDGIPEGAFIADTENPGEAQTPLTLHSGTYQLEEVQVPSGYLELDAPIQFEVKKANVAEVGQDEIPITTITVKDKKPTATLSLQKNFESLDSIKNPTATFQLTVDSTVFNPATGAIIYNKGDVVSVNGAENGLYTTEADGSLTIENLPMSDGVVTYKLKEVSTTDGYVLDENEYTFTFGMTDTTTPLYTQTKTLENKLTNIQVSKQDIGGEEVPGAQMQVIDDQGKVVEEWTSTTEPHLIQGLVVGKTYTLKEKVVAKDYVLANDVEFTVENTTDIQPVKMVDEQFFVQKVNNRQQSVSGATLQVIDVHGDVVDTWTTDGSVHAVNGLHVGETYTLEETKAPEGYVQATPRSFTVEEDEQNETLTLYNKQVLFDKRDDEQNFVEGATMEVTTEDGVLIDTWTTGSDYHAISGLTAGETYTLTETETPEGYVTAEPQTFTVADDNNNEIITMVDKQVFFTKLDSQSQMVEGAKMQVLDGQEQVVDSWQTGTETYAVNGLQDGETYTLRETEAPKGYVRAEDIEFSVPKGQDEQAVVDQNLAMTDVVESVKKVDQFGRPVNGAKLQVTSPDGSIVYDEWTTGQSLVTLTEEQKAELTQNGSLTWEGSLNTEPYQMSTSDEEESEAVQEDKDENVVVRLMNRVSRALGINSTDEEQTEATEQPTEEEPTTPQKTYQFTMKAIDKTSVVTSPDLETEDETNVVTESTEQAYELKAIDEDGTYYYFTIDSEGNELEHRISNLDANTDYVLKEVEAPANHAVSPDINFTTLDNQDQTVEMKDVKLDTVEISKVDIADGKELPGAELKVTDKDGNVVDEWTSTEEPHIIENLVVGEEYTLTEVVAPEFYELAESITFTIEDNDEEVQKITMKDEHKKEDVEISKQDITDKKELTGAHLQITDSEGNVVDEWVSGEEPHIIQNLLVGESYVLTEITAPEYYHLADPIEFTIKEGQTNHLIMYDDPYVDDVDISKQDITTKKELPGAKLDLKDPSGKVIASWTSSDEPHRIKDLRVGWEYTLTETQAPKGYKVAEDIKFKVANNGEVVQTVIMYDEAKEVKTSVDMDKPNIVLPTAIGLGGLGIALLAIRKARKYSE